jgi:hypothetical protein
MKKTTLILLLLLTAIVSLSAQTYTHNTSVKADPPIARPDLPIDYVARYNLAEGGNSFVSEKNTSQSGYFSHADANKQFAHYTIDGVDYHLPSTAEWTGLLSSYYEDGVNFTKEGLLQGIIESISFGDVRYSFANDYYNTGNGLSYALRLCKTSESYDEAYPAATDNKYRCAYRYERVEMTESEQTPPLDAYIKVSVCYLGDDFTGGVSDLTNEGWWQDRQNQIEECIIPALGIKVGGKLYNYASRAFYWATDKAHYTTIYYSGISTSQYPDKSNLCNVRLFRDKKGNDTPQKPTITVTPSSFRIKEGSELVLGKDYHVDITPQIYATKYTVTSSDPMVVNYNSMTKTLKGLGAGEAVITFQISDSDVRQQVSITVIPQAEPIEIAHSTLSDARDFPDLSLLTGTVDTNQIKEYEGSLGLRTFESTRWDAYAHLYVTPQDNLAKTNFYRVNYYHNPQDGGRPYITGQINCVGSLAEAKTSTDFALWLKTNGFEEPLRPFSLEDGSRALITTTKELSLKCWIEKKVFFIIIEPRGIGDNIATTETNDSYSISPIPAKDYIHLSGLQTGSSVVLYTLDGALVYQSVRGGEETLSIPTSSLAEGTYLLLIDGEPHRIIVAR